MIIRILNLALFIGLLSQITRGTQSPHIESENALLKTKIKDGIGSLS